MFIMLMFPLIRIRLSRPPDCHHLQVTSSVWNYLHSIYDGGPEILLRSHASSSCPLSVPTHVDEQISSMKKPAVTFS